MKIEINFTHKSVDDINTDEKNEQIIRTHINKIESKCPLPDDITVVVTDIIEDGADNYKIRRCYYITHN